MTTKPKPLLLVILGPTAVGKSSLAVTVAEWITDKKVANYSGAEIVSADSRQVYKGLDIGTGKITTEEMHGIPHHLLDVADPHMRFTAIQWKVLAEKAVSDIDSRGKLPIICGGTGFYISTLIDNLGFPDVAADTDEQSKLELKSAEELFLELKKIDPERASTIDPKNKRRLARAIIIANALGSVPPISAPSEKPYDVCMIGIKLPDNVLREKIHARLIQRINAGMIDEAKRLHQGSNSPANDPLSYERLDELGLEYRYLSLLLQEKITREEMVEKLTSKIWQYAKRQMTWFKRDQRITWFDPTDLQGIFRYLSSWSNSM
jgi:tRNA dimethylallyltransferase